MHLVPPRRTFAATLAIAGALFSTHLLSQAPPPPAARLSRDITVRQDSLWTTTDIALQPGERIVFAAKGTGRCPGEAAAFGPGGIPRGFRDLLRILPVGQASRGALIGRLGESDASRPFVIGPSAEMVASTAGPLTIGLNRAENDACASEFTVHVDVYPVGDGTKGVGARQAESLDGADQALFAKLPRRVNDQQGNPGDMVNFLILGSDEGMQRTFKAAGWVIVDRDVKGALLQGVINSLSKEAYLTLPMSQLFLFNRPQDFGWAHAEPIKVVASRHHLRVWKAPFQVGSSTLWVGAATHDIGFDRDQRNNGITHKIDPEVDLERTFVEQTLTSTGLVSTYTYVTPSDPLREAKTATGGMFRSDGRVLVLRLEEPNASGQAAGGR